MCTTNAINQIFLSVIAGFSRSTPSCKGIVQDLSVIPLLHKVVAQRKRLASNDCTFQVDLSVEDSEFKTITTEILFNSYSATVY